MKSVLVHRTPLTLALGAIVLFGAGEARAQDRDWEAMEKRLEELERQLAELRARSQGGEASELEARVADLEKLTKKDKDGLFAYWKTGLRLDSADKAFRLKIGGRIMNDYTWWSGDSDTERAIGDTLESGAEFRRVRMYMAGTIYKNTEYKLQYEFADGGSFKDVYIGFKDLIPGATLRAGHQYVPFGLEELTSSKAITFVERGTQTTFAPSRQTGLKVFGNALEKALHWSAMAFYLTTDAFGNHENDSNGEYNFAARVAYRPWVSDEGDEYIHMGAALALLQPNDDTIRYRQRPQVHISPRFVDTGSMMSDDVTAKGLELAGVFGPFHVMGEYAGSAVNRKADPTDPTVSSSNVDFHAYVLQAGYFLTGEHRPYKNGQFGRIMPKSNRGDEDGIGAIEAAARFSRIDLDDKDVRGGKMNIWSIGLNWYLNPNTVIKLDYEWIDLDRKDATTLTRAEDVRAITLRFQIDF